METAGYQKGKVLIKNIINIIQDIVSVKNIDRFLPVKTYITKKKNQHLYELRVNRLSDIKELFEWLYMDTDEEIRLNRKFDKFYEIYNG